jgi:hypothetical protein
VSESPGEAVEETLKLIANELGDEGLALKPGLILKRKQGDQTHSIRAQCRTRNRAGAMARFELSAWFESDVLSSWCKERWPGRPASVTKFDRVVGVLDLKLPDSPRHAEWDVVELDVRHEVAAEAASIIRSQALPWFEKMSDPVTALAELGATPKPRASLIHYAVAAGRSDAARERIAALANSSPHFAGVLEAVRQDGKPAAYRNAFEPLAWAAVDCGIA